MVSAKMQSPQFPAYSALSNLYTNPIFVCFLHADSGYSSGPIKSEEYLQLDSKAQEIAKALGAIEAIAPRELWTPNYKQ